MSFLLYLIVTLFVISCIILMLLILIQKGRGGGLSSSFGGGGGSGHTAFGAKTGDVLTWATSVVFGVFLILAVAANLAFNATTARTGVPPVVLPTATSGGGVPNQTPAGSTGPGKSNSSLPQAPVTADPGVANTPPGPSQPEVKAPAAAPSTQPTISAPPMAAPAMSAPTTLPTTNPAK